MFPYPGGRHAPSTTRLRRRMSRGAKDGTWDRTQDSMCTTAQTSGLRTVPAAARQMLVQAAERDRERGARGMFVRFCVQALTADKTGRVAIPEHRPEGSLRCQQKSEARKADKQRSTCLDDHLADMLGFEKPSRWRHPTHPQYPVDPPSTTAVAGQLRGSAACST